MAESKPAALILGGQPLTLPLARYLLQQDLVSFVRVADKHLCIPAQNVWLTFVDSKTKSVLSQAAAENKFDYVQANLALEPSREKAFTPPSEAQTFEYIFDLIGEGTERAPEVVQIERAKASAACGRLAAARGIKAYVRLTTNYVECKDPKGKVIKEDDPTILPWSMNGKWAWEADRALAAISDLNLVLARTGSVYGFGLVSKWSGFLLIGEIYRYTKEEMQMLWSPDLPCNSLHLDDACSALWTLGGWMSKTGRAEADKAAASPLSPCRPIAGYVKWLSIPPSSSDYDAKEIDGLAPRTAQVKAPLFNVVDDSNSTLGDCAKVVGDVQDIKVGFANSIVNAFAKLNMKTVVSEANEQHLQDWPEILAKSTPPITNPPINPTMPPEELSKHGASFDGSKLRQLTGWKPKAPKLTQDAVKEVLDQWRAEEGVWPNAPQK